MSTIQKVSSIKTKRTSKMKRETLNSIFAFFMDAFTHYEYIGADNIPKEGGVIVVTNHMSRIDIFVLALNPTRPHITALVADNYQKNPLFKVILNAAEIIWLDRTKADFGAFRVALEALKQGHCLGIAVEGTRSQTGQLLEGKPGTVLLATKSEVPIVPVGLAGTETTFSDLLHFRRPKIVARFGPAFRLPPLQRDSRDEDMKQYTDEIMCRIAATLPEKYHGFYANHPRLKELLAEQAG
jgi:1-acyl-sn-glycerol-3-phosphate acyltransferase